jgi:hypothetical protein
VDFGREGAKVTSAGTENVQFYWECAIFYRRRSLLRIYGKLSSHKTKGVT